MGWGGGGRPQDRPSGTAIRKFGPPKMKLLPTPMHSVGIYGAEQPPVSAAASYSMQVSQRSHAFESVLLAALEKLGT